MTYSKAMLFDPDLQEIAGLSRVLSHPARLAILRFLNSQNTCISGDISSELPLSRTTVSQHLQELKKAGLIKGEIEGTKVCYCIDAERISEVSRMFNSFLLEIIKSNHTVCN